jgi:DNA-3-methyladenine glycosylase II
MHSRDRALKHFKKADPRFYKATKPHHASLPSRLAEKRGEQALFSALVSIVVSQQLGTAAADTIFARVKKACGGKITPASVLRVRPASLSKAGLSGAKTKTIKEIAKAVSRGELDLRSLGRIPEAEAAERLMRIWGLGPWSVEMFLMFSLGRPDVFSAGDLGLMRAIETIYALPKGAPREDLARIASVWAPYRTYACLLLWRSRDNAPAVAAKKTEKGRHR